MNYYFCPECHCTPTSLSIRLYFNNILYSNSDILVMTTVVLSQSGFVPLVVNKVKSGLWSAFNYIVVVLCMTTVVREAVE